MEPTDPSSPPRGRLAGVALVSAAVLLLQLVQTRVFSVMLWHHLTYLVVTFTLLGFAAGGALLACRPSALAGDASARLAKLGLWFGVTALASYALITRLQFEDSHSRAGIAMAALNYAVLVVPMVFGGMAVALALSDARAGVGRVYAWNMGGSALGCAVYVPVLRTLGGEGSIVFAAALAFAGALLLSFGVPAPGRPRLRRLCLGATALALIVSVAAPKLFFEVPVASTKAMRLAMELAALDPDRPDLQIEHTRWDPIARLDVVGPGPGDSRSQRTIYQDGDAPTVLPMGSPQKRVDVLDKEGLAYLLFPDTAPRVLAIGIGGGVDVIQATAEARRFPDGSQVDFTGVEINASMADLMRDLYFDETDGRYGLPNVEIHVDEGRSWLRRSEQQYDIIQMTGTDTYTALSSGSYVMSESYLYTLEAYRDFLDHLTDDGVICALRFRFEPPRETLRLAAIVVEALRERGVERPQDHIVQLGIKGGRLTMPDGTVVGIDYGVLLVRKRPFRPDEIDLYRRYCEAVPQLFLMHAPGIATSGIVTDYFAAVAAGSDDRYRAEYIYNLEPVTDDDPFFFRYHRWNEVWEHLLGTREAVPDSYTGIVGGEPIGLIMLVTVLVESAVLVALLVLVPLWVFRREGLKVPGAFRWVLYFFGLGAGYILVEVATMQRFVLFLGHPGYAITVVLITFLVFSALGASVAGRSDDPRRTLRRALPLIVVLIVILRALLPAFFDATLLLPLSARIALTVVVLGPVAFLMGMPFPSGLALVSRRAGPLVPWAFGINGGASVIASVAGILVAMAYGFSTAFAVAAAAYLVSWLAGAARDGATGAAGS